MPLSIYVLRHAAESYRSVVWSPYSRVSARWGRGNHFITWANYLVHESAKLVIDL